jgi:hypothetical protein
VRIDFRSNRELSSTHRKIGHFSSINYGIEYLNLNPNGVFHTAVFVHFCEAFLGIKPHWVLFRKFFRVKPQPSATNPRVVGGANIQLREDAAEQYLAYKLVDSNTD